jgi:MarR family transcriptional regulator, lower aerobic nicotinate degradation pathway regulator
MASCNAQQLIQLQEQRILAYIPRAAVQPSPPAVEGPLEEFEEVAQLIAHARRKVWTSVGRVLALEGEAVLGWALVAVLNRLGPSSQRDLADVIGQHPAGVSRQLAELDAAGLTTRTKDATDGRCRLVALTPRGRRWHRRWRPRVLAVVRDVLGVLDETERDALRASLRKVLAPREAEPMSTPRRARSTGVRVARRASRRS